MPGSGTDRRSTTRIVVVDDHPIVRKGLIDLFDEQADMTVCGQADSIASTMALVAGEHPDVAVVDLTLGHESGLDLVARLVAAHPAIRVLVLSGHDERLYAERALRAGALGYVMKDQAAPELVGAVRRVAAGHCAVSADTADRILSTLGAPKRASDGRSPLERLSDREHHVLRLLGDGLTTAEIARELKLSVKTIESHFAHLKEKLGARNGRELTRLAISWTGAISPSVSSPPRSSDTD